jgi:purine-binding chemotaxis protein CheW
MCPEIRQGEDPNIVLERLKELQRQIDDLRAKLDIAHETDEVPAGPFQILLCRVASERVAFLHDSVDQVVLIAKLLPLPEARDWVAGLLNLRGSTIPVIDIARRVFGKAHSRSLSDLIVVCSHQQGRVGLLVQEALGTYRSDHNRLDRPPRDLACAPYVLGVLSLEDGPALLLGASSLVTTSQLPETNHG